MTNKSSPNYFSGKYFEVTSDIDLKDHYFVPLKQFQANINGNMHTISNVSLHCGETVDYIGFIGSYSASSSTSKITAQNLIIDGISSGYVDYCYRSMGGFAGHLGYANIENIAVKKNMMTLYATRKSSYSTATRVSHCIGGVIGDASSSSSIKCVDSMFGQLGICVVDGCTSYDYIYLGGIVGSSTGVIESLMLHLPSFYQ